MNALQLLAAWELCTELFIFAHIFFVRPPSPVLGCVGHATIVIIVRLILQNKNEQGRQIPLVNYERKFF